MSKGEGEESKDVNEILKEIDEMNISKEEKLAMVELELKKIELQAHQRKLKLSQLQLELENKKLEIELHKKERQEEEMKLLKTQEEEKQKQLKEIHKREEETNKVLKEMISQMEVKLGKRMKFFTTGNIIEDKYDWQHFFSAGEGSIQSSELIKKMVISCSSYIGIYVWNLYKSKKYIHKSTNIWDSTIEIQADLEGNQVIISDSCEKEVIIVEGSYGFGCGVTIITSNNAEITIKECICKYVM